MASDKVSIDLSEFLAVVWKKNGECDDRVVLKGIREHMQWLKSSTEIEEVKLLGPTGFYLPGIEEDIYQCYSIFYPECRLTLQILVDALKAIFPEGQQCTIERVELPFQHDLKVTKDPSNVEGPRLTVNNLCLYECFMCDDKIYVEENKLAAQLDMLQNLGVDFQQKIVVC